jgi:hemoglobin
MEDPTAHIYHQLADERPFYALVEEFYRGVASDEIIRPMYPEDLVDARRHLTLFLIQRFGGPAAYTGLRGHPRLRMRHVPFRIGAAERDAWLRHMNAALATVPELAPFAADLKQYFQSTAEFLVNADS